MLPSIKRLREKKEKPSQTGVSVQVRPPDVIDPSDELEGHAVRILMAIAAKDHKALAEALYDIFCTMEME